jgi:hypothetical protein
MIIPMTVRANYMVDGVPHARVVHHLPTDGLRRGKVCTRSAPQVGAILAEDRQAATAALGSRFAFQFQGSRLATLLAG